MGGRAAGLAAVGAHGKVQLTVRKRKQKVRRFSWCSTSARSALIRSAPLRSLAAEVLVRGSPARQANPRKLPVQVN